TDKIPAVSPSIPSKYQTVVIINDEKKGFLSQTRRFPSQLCLSDAPGPGSYGCVSSAEVCSPSFSKKGTSGFVASKTTRNFQKNSPGPNEYNLQSSLIKKSDFNAGASRVFRLPVAVQIEGPKDPTPAPNQYHVGSVNTVRFSSVAGTSSFLSKTSRDSTFPNRNVPSPGRYEVSSSLIQSGSRALLSPFRSKTQRSSAAVDKGGPGPGAYSPHQAPVKRTVLPRRHYLALSAPPLVVPKDPPPPGPGQYDIRDHKPTSKRLRPTAAFASRTQRIPQTSGAEMIPGPGFYDPQLQSKQSFFYNDSRVWLPA
uniref:Sperm-tail PG-rich repeat containing 1 n=1 Tax=Acanthochromis polyacanthus TaxID=80966 RepID=A0A3Q1EBQ7_9TELE